MVHSVMRPMTIAAAAALVASSARASFNPVYADETEEQSGFDHDHRASLLPHLVDKSEIKPEEVKSKFRREANSRSPNHTNTRSVLAPEEDLFPGIAYVAIAGLTGSLAARQGGTLLKALSPVAFASAAGYYFLPHTARNLLGVDQPSYNKWASSHVSSSSSHSSTSALPRADLTSKAREAWHTAEVKADKLDTKIDNKTQEVKQWWNKNSSIAEDSIKTQVNDVKAKATGAIDSAKGWVEDKSRLVQRPLGNASASIPSDSGSSSLKSETEKTWFHHDQDRHPESTTHTSKSRFSTRSGTAGIGAAGAASGLESHDHWSTGEEQGTSKIREDGGYWLRQAGFNSNGGLDNKGVDVWSSTKEEMGTARVDETSYANSHRKIFTSDRLPHETEYWTNGEEISSADIRDASYYNWPGSRNSTSLGRSSWWDRRFRSSPGDLDASVSIRSSTESFGWESKRAAERAALDLANRLAQEQSDLEKKAADARARAEAAARQAKSTSDALIRERQISMERSAKELEMRLATEKAAADRAVADAKARAQAWELEQRTLAEQSAREVQERVLREKAEADAAAAQIKLRAEAWARDQKEKADLIAKEIHHRATLETAAAEKAAQEAKAALETRIREEKLKIERNAREIEERIRMEKLKEEQANAELRAQAETFAREQRLKVERAAKEMEEKLAHERAQKAAYEAKVRAEAEAMQKKLAAEKAAKELEVQKKMAAERAAKAARDLEIRLTREREDAAALEKKRASERAAKEMADRLAFEKAEAAAREAKAHAEAMLQEKKRHAELAAREMERVKAIEKAEAAAREAKLKAESLLMEQKRTAERSLKDMESRLATDRAEAAAREARAHADALAAEKKLASLRTSINADQKRTLEMAEAAARDARAKADALLSEKNISASRAAKEMEQKLSAERAEAEALAAKNRAESNLAERKRAAELSARESSSSISREHSAYLEREARLRSQLDGLKAEMRDSTSPSSSGSSWSWPWSRSSNTTATSTASTKHSHDGFDSTGHLMEHIVEDIKQTKSDISDGLHNLKDAFLGAEAKAAEATTNTRETIVEAVNAAKPERRSWWSSGSSSSTSSSSSSSYSPDITTKISDLGTNVERVAAKAERDVHAKAETVGRNMSETARKAYDNVIDAATTAEGQRVYTHHHHEHSGSANGYDGPNLMDHIRDDLQSTKESLQSGVDSLKETIFGAEQATHKAASEIQDGVKQAKDDGRRWWSAKTHEAEKSANRLESELRAGLNKASGKIREFDENLGNVTAGREAASDDDYWFHAEQARQQKSSRGSGRAM
ncbi:hypothetical protein K457DRAFT_126999 [Linnemannia elongata AG-77]|uniref:MICOS complex subunit n=1 Tax=Linnemannia elongata AG-77 TaxID=1314771 RepID=A0A197JRP0_9FUNG|nr:hypothetical protein K457DRAFT_126999 [Linnemannia elongata AG-77]